MERGQQVPMCYDMERRSRRGTNRAFMGEAVLGISFTTLVFSLILLAAQIGYFYYCDWQALWLFIPAFFPAILGIICSIIGIFAGTERTNSLIMTCMIFAIIILLGTPVSMGLWGWALDSEDSSGSSGSSWSSGSSDSFEVPPFSLESNDDQDDALTAITWGLLLLPILNWILFLAVTILCCIALCCPKECGMSGGHRCSHGKTYLPQPAPVYATGAQVLPQLIQAPQQQVVSYPQMTFANALPAAKTVNYASVW